MSQFTAQQLLAYNGTDPSKPLLIAIRGKVYDVTAGSNFYGPGGPYNVFAGRECARALAIMKVEASECNDCLDDLDEKQLKTLADWEAKLAAKYGVVGTVV